MTYRFAIRRLWSHCSIFDDVPNTTAGFSPLSAKR